MSEKKIKVHQDGPYAVAGSTPLVRKKQVSSEHGEPLTWEKTAELETQETAYLCRCGQSSNKPFCDGTHSEIGFDGTETAPTDSFEERKVIHEGSTGIVIKRDYAICSEAGFCGNRLANIEKLAKETDESTVRSQVIAMIERCPSGSYTYALTEDGEDVEPDYPVQVAVTTEMTDEGPIMGPLWVTGSISVERSDGEPLETRNRVVLCRCGQSSKKPLCDGTHRTKHITE